MKILVTAFEPFGGETVNPALEAVKLLKEEIASAQIIKLGLPTVYKESTRKIYEAMCREKPDAVLSIGQAGGRSCITPERVAINLDDCGPPDNEGNQLTDEPIFADGETAYFTSLPVKAMVKAIRERGIPAALSTSAGTYVCNHVMYSVLYFIDKYFPGTKGGFIHVPFLPDQTVERPDVPSMSLADITAGLEAAIEAIVKNETDLCVPEGKTH